MSIRNVLTILAALIAVNACADTTANTSSPSPTVNQVQAAAQVTSCMQLHHMTYASEIQTNPLGVTTPFLQDNSQPYFSGDPFYSSIYSGSPTITEVSDCAWPPIAGADQTGFSQITFTMQIPGETKWPGDISSVAWADILDTNCTSVTATYSGGQTGTSFTDTATVAANDIVSTQPQTNPPSSPGLPVSLAAWAQMRSLYIVPGEMVILHAGNEHLNSAKCG